MGGVQVYTTALACVINDDLKKEWQKYLDQTKNHEQVVRNLFGKVGLDPEGETPGRAVVRHLGKGLVKAMLMAQQAGHPEEAELVSLLLGGGRHERGRIMHDHAPLFAGVFNGNPF